MIGKIHINIISFGLRSDVEYWVNIIKHYIQYLYNGHKL